MGERVAAGTSPDRTIHARKGSGASSRSSGCVVARRSRQIRPASKRSSYGAMVEPSAMCLSPQEYPGRLSSGIGVCHSVRAIRCVP